LARKPPALDADALMRVVVRVESDIDGDLGLDTLAAEAGLSRAHFQRAFTAAVGVSPAAYVARVRVERAAYLMRVQDRSLLDLALSVGFRNADTFTRAFRRRFRETPRAYRQRGTFAARLVRPAAEPRDGGFSLSPTAVVRLRELRVAFLRNLGPYESVDPSLWTRLVAWAKARGIRHGWFVGIAHDAPSVTAPEDLRFDAGILVGDEVRPSAGVGIQTLPPAFYAVTRHVGAYATLPEAYPTMFLRAAGLRGYRIVGLPCVEVYHDATVDPARPLSATDVHLLVERGR
jgi:AraC family transcriptional regulator